MASRREQNMKYRRYSGRVNGNLAYDPAYEERQRRLRREREYEREHERQREEFMRPPQVGEADVPRSGRCRKRLRPSAVNAKRSRSARCAALWR